MNRTDSRLLAGVALASLLTLAAHAQQPGASAFTTASEIAPSQFDALFASIKPGDSQLRWLEIPWLGTLREGREAAATAKKPMFLWAMNGHPLGTC